MPLRRTTLGQLLVNNALPPELRNYDRVLDKKGVDALLRQVAEKYPDKYRDVSHALSVVGRDAAQSSGGNSFGLQALKRTLKADEDRKVLKQDLFRILADPKIPDDKKDDALVARIGKLAKTQQEEIYQESLKEGNPLAYQVISGARGSKMNLASLRGSDLLYVDHRNRVIPFPILRSYSQGLAPAEYWAGSYGARAGMAQAKFAVRDAGFLSKVLTQTVHRLLVSDLDEPGEPKTLRGLPVDIEDGDNEGALLAAPAGSYGRNTVLTPKILADLKKQGIKRLLVRSPTVGGPEDGGVYARDVGVREFGRLPVRGELPGIAAAHALAEPISQSQLCLAEGTLVRMADWSEKPIEQIRPGEWVFGSDTDGNLRPVRVVRTYNNGLKECVRTVFGLAALVSTPDHKILAKVGSNEPAISPVGLPASEFAAARTGSPVTFVSRQSQEACGELPTYDIEVDHPDHLFVLANGLIVSNSAKHSGGVAGAGASQLASGFPLINALIQSPKVFPSGAAHAEVDGTVSHVEAAPTGGQYLWIEGKRHHIPHGFALKVKPGDQVEAGDVLSEGNPNPAKIVEHKGVGEGRRYFVKAFKDAITGTGAHAHRRNVELLARGLVNHVRLTEEMGDYVPDDVVQYSALEHAYKPREGFQTLEPKRATGKYLERPYLHYSIGTRVRPSVVKELEEFGVTNVDAHDDPPPFVPEMIRGMANLSHDPDWMTQMYGSGLKGSLLKSTHRGASSSTEGTSFVPGLARSADFGQTGKVLPPNPAKPYGT